MASLSFILGDKIVIDPQTTELWPKQQIVTLSVSERIGKSVSGSLAREKLSY